MCLAEDSCDKVKKPNFYDSIECYERSVCFGDIIFYKMNHFLKNIFYKTFPFFYTW